MKEGLEKAILIVALLKDETKRNFQTRIKTVFPIDDRQEERIEHNGYMMALDAVEYRLRKLMKESL